MPATELSSIVDKIAYLPSPSDIATKISRMAEDPRSSAADIAQIIRKDPSTAGRVLKLVNSSYFGLRTQVETLQHAISVLGLKVIRSIALSVSVVGWFKRMKVPASFNHRRFWEHSALTACLAKSIAKEHRGVDPDVAFDVGLMHDIGKLMIACYAPEDFANILEYTKANAASFRKAESALMATGHNEVGGWLARKWNFAPDLIHGISGHHNGTSVAEDPMVAICQFANALTKAKGYRTVGNFERVSVPKGVYKSLGVNDSDVSRLFGDADKEIEKSKQLMSMVDG